MVVNSTSLMLIRHDCADRKGLGHKAWGLLQERFRSNETVTVVSVMRQLARLTLEEDWASCVWLMISPRQPSELRITEI